jgi:hypothetical protein
MWISALVIFGQATTFQVSNAEALSGDRWTSKASQATPVADEAPTAEVWYQLEGTDSVVNLTFTVDLDRSTPGETWLVGDGVVEERDGVAGRIRMAFPIYFAPGTLGIASDGSGLLRMPKSQTLMVIERSATAPVDQDEFRLWNLSGTVADISIERGFAANATVHPELAFAAALAVMLGEGPCEPSFQTCKDSAKDACMPDRYEVSYSCNPETGEVSCSWTCHVAGGGEG